MKGIPVLVHLTKTLFGIAARCWKIGYATFILCECFRSVNIKSGSSIILFLEHIFYFKRNLMFERFSLTCIEAKKKCAGRTICMLLITINAKFTLYRFHSKTTVSKMIESLNRVKLIEVRTATWRVFIRIFYAAEVNNS